MKKPVLALLALLSLFSFTQSTAQSSPVAPPPETTAEFLASLSDLQAETSDDRVPAPLFKTGCGNNPQCGTGEICCYLCGNPPEGDDSGCWGCVTPVKGGGCPQVY
jgi:hypothetical protein